MDIAAWLRALGLERYVPAFRDNEIDWEVLPKLTSEGSPGNWRCSDWVPAQAAGAIAALVASALTPAVTATVSDTSAPPEAERRQLSGRASRRADRLDLAPPGGWLPTYAAV